MKGTMVLALVLVAVGLSSLLIGFGYTLRTARSSQNFSMMGQYIAQSRTVATTISMDQAKSIALQYLAATRNPNLGLKEIMEFQYNFYVIYYEKDTGLGAFEMLIWKESPRSGMMSGGMMAGYTPGVISPEPGPNMMWNTKYSPMASGMMTYRTGTTSMALTKDAAGQIAQDYLDRSIAGAKVEMATQFYGYYAFDFTVNERIAGMLSVNGNSGQVWYHSWHGDFLQEVEFA